MTASASETIQIGGVSVRFLVEGSDSGGSAAVFECFIPAGARVPAAHSHDGYEETIYGLEGVSTWTVDGNPHQVGAGDAICIRRGVVHRFDNETDADAKFLVLVTPGVLGPDYFREVGAVLAGGGPPDLARIHDVMRKHGLTPAAPEPAPTA
jgi:quercetin dioxygenase-like cupin family protein